MIILEENVIPSPDILSFFAQCFPVLKLDETLIGVTAWNENGKFHNAVEHCNNDKFLSFFHLSFYHWSTQLNVITKLCYNLTTSFTIISTDNVYKRY